MGSLEDEVRAGLSGRYEIEGELGRGGMAVVFLATDLRHDRRVAIKVLDPGVAVGPGAARFQREIRTVARLSHPHILPVLDSGELSGGRPRAWFAMPYVAGGSLRGRLEREGPLPVDDAVRIAAEAAEALDYAHREGLVHRDVKPENVLLQDGQAVVADFGIVGTVDTGPEPRLTGTGLVMGTPRYMSPEQATGSDTIDHRTDVYALGCVLFESLTGRTPFGDAATPAGILARVVTEDPPPVSRARPAATGLDPIVARALARVPADRFGTAGELARALRASTPAQGLAPVRTPTGVRSVGAGPGWRRVAAVGTVGVAAIAALALWVGVDGDRTGTRGGGASSERPSLAVLPFENLSADPDDAYLAAGFHEEIRTQLSKVRGIRLIASPPGGGERQGGRRPSEVAAELGVSTILQASVQSAGGQVRVAMQLYDAAADEQLWGETYQRDLSDIFRIQSDVAARVVEEIRGVLSPEEVAELAGPDGGEPDPDAYVEYLRGHRYFRSLYSREDARAAADAYGRAVELDPGFAAAWSRLVQARLFLSFVWGDPEQRGAAREALDRLEVVAPGSAELRMARGLWLYQGVQRYEEALEDFEALADRWPGDVNVLTYLGATQRRLGDWDLGTRTWERALELEPLNGGMASNLAQAYTVMRRFEDAERYAVQSIELGPDVPVHWWHYAWVPLVQGDTASARTVVEAALLRLGRERVETGGWWALWQVHSGHASGVLGTYGELYGTDPRWDGTWGRSWDLGLAVAAEMGDDELLRTFATRLRDRAQEVVADLPADDTENHAEVLSKLALAQAYLGNADRAVRTALDAVEALPVARDAAFGPHHVKVLAQVYAVVGRTEEAVDRIRYLLSIPSEVHPALLRTSPRWASLRDDPDFQALLAEQG